MKDQLDASGLQEVVLAEQEEKLSKMKEGVIKVKWSWTLKASKTTANNTCKTTCRTIRTKSEWDN